MSELFVVDPATYQCGGWSPSEPSADMGLFDLVWMLSVGQEDADGPTVEQREAVLGAGGTIVHEFHVPVVRAILPTERVPSVGANQAIAVQDPRSFAVRLRITFTRGIADEDLHLLESLGGRVLSVSFPIDTSLLVSLPDRAIPAIRAHEGVRLVEPPGIGCALAGTRSPGESPRRARRISHERRDAQDDPPKGAVIGCPATSM